MGASATWLVIAALAVCWLGACAWAVWRIRAGWASRGWPRVQGEVVSLLVRTVPGGVTNSTTYVPTIAYRYSVGERTYEGTRIDAGAGYSSFSQRAAARVLEGYYPGRKVDVYHDPLHQDRALLEPGVSGGMLFIGALLMASGPALVALWLLVGQ